jgi:hypothetical protein
MKTDNTQRDLIEDLECLAKDVSCLYSDLRNLDTKNNLYVMDSLGNSGDLIVSFDRDHSQSLRLLVKTHLETLKTEALCKISRIVDQLLKKD